MTVTKKTKRIRLLDILRGFAIFGTLGTNIWLFAHLGDLNYLFTFHVEWWSSFDDFFRIFVLFLVNGKLLGVLTIMFGAGLELKYRQSLRKNLPWPGTHLWISVFLLLEGLIHYTLVMEYDILMSYALTAIIVSLIIKGGDQAIKRVLIIIGSLHAALILLLLFGVAYTNLAGGNISLGNMAYITALYREGTWLEQISYRISNFVLLRTEAIFIIPMNIVLFLIGVRLMRSGAFLPDDKGRRIRSKMLWIGFGLGVPLNLLIFFPGGVFDLPVRYLFAPLLSVGYMALIARLVEKSEQLRLWTYFEAVGKMALSCYVLQNILASLIFYGWGLGLGGQLGSLAVIGVWLLICMLEMVVAKWWLDRQKFGPLEWARKALLRAFTERPKVSRGN